jgi:hypothetical protein
MAVRLSALRAGSTLPPGRFLVLISVRGWVDPRAIVRLEGLGQLKYSISSGLECVTFLLVAWCRNQLRYRVPPIQWVPRAFFLKVKRPGSQADDSSTSNVEVKNIWSHIATPPYVFLALTMWITLIFNWLNSINYFTFEAVYIYVHLAGAWTLLRILFIFGV